MPHLAQITPSCSAEHVEGGPAKRKPGKKSGADRRRKEMHKIGWLLCRRAERRNIQKAINCTRKSTLNSFFAVRELRTQNCDLQKLYTWASLCIDFDVAS